MAFKSSLIGLCAMMLVSTAVLAWAQTTPGPETPPADLTVMWAAQTLDKAYATSESAPDDGSLQQAAARVRGMLRPLVEVKDGVFIQSDPATTYAAANLYLMALAWLNADESASVEEVTGLVAALEHLAASHPGDEGLQVSDATLRSATAALLAGNHFSEAATLTTKWKTVPETLMQTIGFLQAAATPLDLSASPGERLEVLARTHRALEAWRAEEDEMGLPTAARSVLFMRLGLNLLSFGDVDSGLKWLSQGAELVSDPTRADLQLLADGAYVALIAMLDLHAGSSPDSAETDSQQRAANLHSMFETLLGKLLSKPELLVPEPDASDAERELAQTIAAAAYTLEAWRLLEPASTDGEAKMDLGAANEALAKAQQGADKLATPIQWVLKYLRCRYTLMRATEETDYARQQELWRKLLEVANSEPTRPDTRMQAMPAVALLRYYCCYFKCAACDSLGDYAELERTAAEAIALMPGAPEGSLYWALAVTNQGGLEGAVLLAQQLVGYGQMAGESTGPAAAAADDVIMLCLETIARSSASQRLLDAALTPQVVARAEGRPVGRLLLAIAYVSAGDPAAAHKQLDAIGTDDRDLLWHAQTTRLEAFVHEGRFSEARRVLGDMTAQAGDDALMALTCTQHEGFLVTCGTIADPELPRAARAARLQEPIDSLAKTLRMAKDLVGPGNADTDPFVTHSVVNLAEAHARRAYYLDSPVEREKELRAAGELIQSLTPEQIKSGNSFVEAFRATATASTQQEKAAARDLWDQILSDPRQWSGGMMCWFREEALAMRASLGAATR